MKIRNKITLWITSAGMVAGLLFSVVISYELIEQPYELLDGELRTQAQTILVGLAPVKGQLRQQNNNRMVNSLGKLYWLKIYNKDRNLIFASSMTQFADLPLKKEGHGYNVSARIPREAANIDEDDNDEITFRVHVFTRPLGGYKYLIHIARPMEKLEEEYSDLAIAIPLGMLAFALALVPLAYFASGKILQPIASINALAKEISEKTLDRRIPLGKNHDELYSLSSSLNRMFDRLQYSFQHQKEFLANASHELKTPLFMQRLFFDEAWLRDDLPDDFQHQIDVQIQNCYRMDRLIKNLLDLSALELKNTFERCRVDVTAMATSVLHDFKEIIVAAGIKLTVDIQPNIRMQADEEKIRRLIINVLDNAIKYNSGEKLELRFILQADKDRISINVFNTCKGIPPEDLGLVFDQFYRVEKSRSMELGGSGLGLTIVKRIVELHNGTITIENESNNGVWVSISLPSA